MSFSITPKRAAYLRAIRDEMPVPTQNNRFGGQSDQPAGHQLRRAGLWRYVRGEDGRMKRALTQEGAVVLRQYEKQLAAGDETPLKLHPRRTEGSTL